MSLESCFFGIEQQWHQNAEDLTGAQSTFLELLPQSRYDLFRIVQLANLQGLKLHAVSTGKNWGLGSKRPPPGIGVVVNLCKLNRILEISEEHGYVRIEAGVTQQQLYDALKAKNSQWFLDVTGSGAQTSILGNALARGISYHAMRVDKVSKIKAVNTDGSLYESGFHSRAPVAHLYKHGIGADDSGSYFQSHRGIVFEASYRLEPLPECFESFSLQFPHEALDPVLQRLRRLLRQGVLRQNVHLANPERYLPSLAPNFQKFGDYSRDEASRFIMARTGGEWLGTGSLFGPVKMVRAARKEVKKSLQDYCKVHFFSANKFALLKKIFSLSKSGQSLCKAMELARGLALGVPTNGTLQSMVWPVSDAILHADELDSGPWGAAFLSPVCALDGPLVGQLVSTCQETAAPFGFKPAITVNTPANELAELVVSLHYQKKAEHQKAMDCLSALEIAMQQLGAYSYRPSILDSLDRGRGKSQVQLHSLSSEQWINIVAA